MCSVQRCGVAEPMKRSFGSNIDPLDVTAQGPGAVIESLGQGQESGGPHLEDGVLFQIDPDGNDLGQGGGGEGHETGGALGQEAEGDVPGRGGGLGQDGGARDLGLQEN